MSAQEFENLNPQQLRVPTQALNQLWCPQYETVFALQSRIRISFPGESEAVEWGAWPRYSAGVARTSDTQEWFLMIIPALLDASLGLFELSPHDPHDKYQVPCFQLQLPAQC